MSPLFVETGDSNDGLEAGIRAKDEIEVLEEQL